MLGGGYEPPRSVVAHAISSTIRMVFGELLVPVSEAVAAFTASGGKAPQHLYLTGGGSRLAFTDRFFSTKLGMQVSQLEPFTAVDVDERTANFLESHDLDTYVAANRREWFEIHRVLSGRDMAESECLPYVFDKLVEKKLR